MRQRVSLLTLLMLLFVLLVPAAARGTDSHGLTVSVVGSTSNQWITEYNRGDGFFWTMTTAGFDAIGKLSLAGTFTMVDGFVGGGGGASTETMQMLHGIGSKGTLYVYDCNWGGSWWTYDAATHRKTSIGRNWTNPAVPNPGCGAQLSGMATNAAGTILYWHVGDKIWALDPTARTAKVVLADTRFAAGNGIYTMTYDAFTDTLLGKGLPGGVPTIYRLDVKQGTAAVIPVPGLEKFYWAVPDPLTGLIYSAPSPNPDGTLYQIDPVTGAFESFQLGAGTFTYPVTFAPSRSGTGRSLYGMLSGSPQKAVEVAGTFPIRPAAPADTTPPVISVSVTPGANGEGWHNSDVTVLWEVSDPESGVASSSGCDPSLLTAETAGLTLTCTAENGAGLTASASATVRIDRTPPAVEYSGNLGTYTVDQDVDITCEASDSLSGLASSTCAAVAGTAYTFALGVNSFSAEAVDRAGNTGTGSVSFEVIVTFDSLGKLAERFVTRPGILRSLQAKLEAAGAAAARGNTRAAAGALEAFIHEVEAQSGKAISAESATLLIDLAQYLRAQL